MSMIHVRERVCGLQCPWSGTYSTCMSMSMSMSMLSTCVWSVCVCTVIVCTKKSVLFVLTVCPYCTCVSAVHVRTTYVRTKCLYCTSPYKKDWYKYVLHTLVQFMSVRYVSRTCSPVAESYSVQQSSAKRTRRKFFSFFSQWFAEHCFVFTAKIVVI